MSRVIPREMAKRGQEQLSAGHVPRSPGEQKSLRLQIHECQDSPSVCSITRSGRSGQLQTVESSSDGLGEPQSVSVGIGNLEVTRPRHLVGTLRPRAQQAARGSTQM